jgi:hypothetical protein
MSAGDNWGISISEEDTEERLTRSNTMWRIAHSGFIKFIKNKPALEEFKAIRIGLKLAKDMKG